MLIMFSASSSANYFCWFSSIYVIIKLFTKLYSLIRIYLVPRIKNHDDFKKYGRWAVITGSTDGIGKGFAEELAKQGLDICLISRNEEKLQNTARQLENRYCIQTTYIVADFTNLNVYDHIEKNLDGLDVGILVNNVGIAGETLEPFIRHDKQLVRDIINVNVFSTIFMTWMIAPKMVAKKRGLIVNISSMTGQFLLPYLSMYSSTKHFINCFGRSLSEELKEHNVQVTTLMPGFIRTNLTDKFPIIDNWLGYIPKFVINVKEFVQDALIAVNSGHFLYSGCLAHELYLLILTGIPISVRTVMMKFSIYLSNKKNK